MGLQRFERRLERLVEGGFAKAFRSGLQPVEIGRRVVREVEAGRTIGVRGTVVPNHFTVLLSAADRERFDAFGETLAQELADAVRDHAREEGYHFVGAVSVDLVEEPRHRKGDFKVRGEIVEGEGPTAELVLPDGRRVLLGEEPARIGRMPDCAVTLSDTQVSRHHAEVRPGHGEYRIVDLGSTNGTLLNGVVVAEHALADGDEISVGNTTIRFEET